MYKLYVMNQLVHQTDKIWEHESILEMLTNSSWSHRLKSNV
jgi:hypothetical protein